MGGTIMILENKENSMIFKVEKKSLKEKLMGISTALFGFQAIHKKGKLENKDIILINNPSRPCQLTTIMIALNTETTIIALCADKSEFDFMTKLDFPKKKFTAILMEA